MLAIENHSNYQDLRLSLTQSQYNLGKAFARYKFWKEAIDSFRLALQIQPHFKIYSRLAKVWVEVGKIPEAINCYQKAIELQPNEVELHSQLGNLLYEHQDWEAAQQAYQKALELNAMLPEVQGNLGNLYAQQKNFERALECYQEAIQIDPELAGVYQNWGKLYLELNRMSEAIECYRQAIKIEPDSAKAYFGLGEALSQQEKWEEAIACLRQALALQPDFSDARLQLTQALSRKDREPTEGKSINRLQKLERQLQLLTYQVLVLPGLQSEKITIEASFPLPGDHGFYRAEYGPDGKHFRWTNRQFYFDLGIDRQQPIAFVMTILPFNWEETIESMQGFDGETELELTGEWENGIFYLKGVLPPKKQVGYTLLSFIVPRAIEDSENTDASGKGIAFFELNLQVCG
jgi:tetratricopeptide (TPR) repeat protein